LKPGKQAVERATYYEEGLLIVGLYCLRPTRRSLIRKGDIINCLAFAVRNPKFFFPNPSSVVGCPQKNINVGGHLVIYLCVANIAETVLEFRVSKNDSERQILKYMEKLLNTLFSVKTNDEIKSRIAIAKAAFNEKVKFSTANWTCI
jgi:hypothetical protein